MSNIYNEPTVGDLEAIDKMVIAKHPFLPYWDGKEPREAKLYVPEDGREPASYLNYINDVAISPCLKCNTFSHYSHILTSFQQDYFAFHPHLNPLPSRERRLGS